VRRPGFLSPLAPCGQGSGPSGFGLEGVFALRFAGLGLNDPSQLPVADCAVDVASVVALPGAGRELL
jgi:hypothetical protein